MGARCRPCHRRGASESDERHPPIVDAAAATLPRRETLALSASLLASAAFARAPARADDRAPEPEPERAAVAIADADDVVVDDAPPAESSSSS